MSHIPSRRRRLLTRVAGTVAALSLAAVSHAQTPFPDPGKPIRIVVPYTAGGSSDFIARTVAGKLGEVMKHSVVVDNRPGGNTVIATESVARAAPDGHTLLLLGQLTFASVAALNRQLPFDAARDIAPITNAIESPLVVVVNPTVPAKTLSEFIDWAKSRPGQVAYGSAGIGNTLHLAGESFAAATGVKLNHIPYKGASQAVVDLVGGVIQVMFDLPQTPLPNIQAGKLRALAVTGTDRLAILPDVPTTAQAGLPNWTFATRVGFAAPGGTPPAVLDALHAAIVKVLAEPDVKAAFADKAMFVKPSASPTEYRRAVDNERVEIGRLLKNAGIEPQ